MTTGRINQVTAFRLLRVAVKPRRGLPSAVCRLPTAVLQPVESRSPSNSLGPSPGPATNQTLPPVETSVSWPTRRAGRRPGASEGDPAAEPDRWVLPFKACTACSDTSASPPAPTERPLDGASVLCSERPRVETRSGPARADALTVRLRRSRSTCHSTPTAPARSSRRVG
jgi:hypothetical protein